MDTRCARCGARVYCRGAHVLDAVRVAGGLYELDQLGRPRRRRLADMAAEYATRRRVHGGGYEPHECPDEEQAATYSRAVAPA